MQTWVLLRSNKIYLKDCPVDLPRTLKVYAPYPDDSTVPGEALSPPYLMLGLLTWNWLLLSIYDLLKMQACLYMHVTCWGEFKGKNVQVCVLSRFSHVWLCQAPLSMGFSRQEYWSGLWFPTPGYVPDTGIKPAFLMSPASADGFFTH